MSIVFVGTPQFAVPSLQRLAADGHTISAIVTQPDRPAGRGRQLRPSPVKQAAEQLGIPVQQPTTLRDPASVDQIAALKPKVLVVVAYGQVLRREVLDIAPFGVLNIHPSLLPRWRGASPIPATILAGDSQTGASIIIMDAGMDSGPILAQEPIEIQPSDNTATLAERLALLSADLLARTLPHWLNSDIEPQPQDESRVTTCSRLRKEDGTINWNKPAVEIWRHVRAYNPWPGAHTTLGLELLHIWEAWPLDAHTNAPPGTIVLANPETLSALPDLQATALCIQTGRSILAVTRLQRAGRRALPAADFLRGAPHIVGKLLGPP